MKVDGQRKLNIESQRPRRMKVDSPEDFWQKYKTGQSQSVEVDGPNIWNSESGRLKNFQADFWQLTISAVFLLATDIKYTQTKKV